MLRYVAGTDEPIYPIGYIQCKNPMNKKRAICNYTEEGRTEIHDSLRINKRLMIKLMRQPLYGRSCEYAVICLKIAMAIEAMFFRFLAKV